MYADNIAMTVGDNAIAARSMLVSITIAQWQGRKLDRNVTDQINNSHNATSDAGRYNKLLLNPKAFRNILSIVGRIRSGFYQRTLPWMDDGQRIMSANAYGQFVNWFNTESAAFYAARDEFIADYPAFIAERQLELGDMFNPYDYPSIEELESKFSLNRKIMPVPSGEDFRVDMAQAQIDLVRADIERDVAQAANHAMRDVYRRITEVTQRMADKLQNYRPAFRQGDKSEGVFRDSLVENIRDLVNVLPALNITGDNGLYVLGKRMEVLTRHDAEELRRNSQLRRDVAEEAKAINDSISDFFA